MLHGRFHDMSVLVTGAAGGIGRATALRLAGEGARLALADRDGGALVDLASAVREVSGADPATLVYAAADMAASSHMAANAADALGGVDCAVCNAGIYRRAPFAAISDDAWAQMLAVNLSSVACIARTLIPHLVRSRGNMVMVSSIAAITGIVHAAHYAAAKAGLVALVKSLAVEYAPEGARFNAICPGKVKTGMSSGQPPLPAENPALAVRPPRLAGRTGGGEPEDIAAAIAYLGSSDARYISGSALVVDGTQTVG